MPGNNTNCYCPRWNAFERCSQFVCLFFLSSCSWSWWEWREIRVGTGTDVTPAGGVWLRPTVCVSILVGVFVRQMSTKYQISPITDIVIAKFHVTNINNHYLYKYPVVVPLFYIVPSAKRFVRHYRRQPARNDNSMRVNHFLTYSVCIDTSLKPLSSYISCSIFHLAHKSQKCFYLPGIDHRHTNAKHVFVSLELSVVAAI